MDTETPKINDLDEKLDDDPTSELEALPETYRVDSASDDAHLLNAQTLLLTQQVEELSARNKQLETELEIRNELVDLYRREISAMKQAMQAGGGQPVIHPDSKRRENVRAAPVTEARLVGLNGDASTRYVISPGRTTLGSSPDNDIQLSSNFISRHHAQIDCNSGDYILRDLTSTNGTFVNSNRVRRHALREGDSITIGTLRLKFVMDPGPGRRPESQTNGAQA
jgi:hypothetical protein